MSSKAHLHSFAGVRVDVTTASAVATAVEGFIASSLAKPLVCSVLLCIYMKPLVCTHWPLWSHKAHFPQWRALTVGLFKLSVLCKSWSVSLLLWWEADAWWVYVGT